MGAGANGMAGPSHSKMGNDTSVGMMRTGQGILNADAMGWSEMQLQSAQASAIGNEMADAMHRFSKDASKVWEGMKNFQLLAKGNGKQMNGPLLREKNGEQYQDADGHGDKKNTKLSTQEEMKTPPKTESISFSKLTILPLMDAKMETELHADAEHKMETEPGSRRGVKNMFLPLTVLGAQELNEDTNSDARADAHLHFGPHANAQPQDPGDAPRALQRKEKILKADVVVAQAMKISRGEEKKRRETAEIVQAASQSVEKTIKEAAEIAPAASLGVKKKIINSAQMIVAKSDLRVRKMDEGTRKAESEIYSRAA